MWIRTPIYAEYGIYGTVHRLKMGGLVLPIEHTCTSLFHMTEFGERHEVGAHAGGNHVLLPHQERLEIAPANLCAQRRRRASAPRTF